MAKPKVGPEDEKEQVDQSVLDWLDAEVEAGDGAAGSGDELETIKVALIRLRRDWTAERITAKFAYKTGAVLEDQRMKDNAAMRAQRAIRALEYLAEELGAVEAKIQAQVKTGEPHPDWQ